MDAKLFFCVCLVLCILTPASVVTSSSTQQKLSSFATTPSVALSTKNMRMTTNMTMFTEHTINNISNSNNNNNNNTATCRGDDYFKCLVDTFAYHKSQAVPVVAGLGATSNVVIIIVLRQPELRLSPYVHLTALAVADTCALVGEFLKYTLVYPNVFPYCTASLERVYLHVSVINPLVEMCGEFGLYVLVLMALERCVELQFPFRSLRRSSSSSFNNGGSSATKVKVAVLAVVVMLVNCPMFVWYKGIRLPEDELQLHRHCEYKVITMLI